MSRPLRVGRRVIATNEAGGKWRGWVVGQNGRGQVLVECYHIDIGRGWQNLLHVEIKAFDAAAVEVSDLRQDH